MTWAVLYRILGVPADDPDLVRSQYAALSRQIPLLYALLAINSGFLAATHFDSAPLSLSLFVPGALCLLTTVRAITWSTRQHRPVDAAEAAKRLCRTALICPPLTLAFDAWSLSLFHYGDDYARAHVAFYMAVTAISMVFCLMHLRAAALSVAVSCALPFSVFFIATGQPMLVAITVNFLLVLGSLLWILLRNNQDFASLIVSQRELRLQHDEAAMLARDNRRLANVDSLTGLPNRRSFKNQLGLALEDARASHTRLAVALLDLDGFKGVNDAYGHPAGDALLVEAGRRLTVFVSPSLTVARLGGDEFGAFLTGSPSDQEVQSFGTAVCAALRTLTLESGLPAGVSVSVGMVTYPEGADTAQRLFEQADYALYYAKAHRRGEAVLFNVEHETMIRETSRLEHALRGAALADELTLQFQPLVDIVSETVMGFEALARWNSPVLGRVGPSSFIPAAERIGLVHSITCLICEKALAEAATWPDELPVSINLSASDLASRPTMAALRSLIERRDLDPARIILEITETDIMHDIDQAIESIAPLRTLGVRIALDDFGTGYSSFSQVHRLVPDIIKVDRSFVANLHDNQLSRDILRTILDMSRNIGARCIVEGIENWRQRHQLAGLGCRYMQGYLFSMPVSDPASLLEQWHRSPMIPAAGSMAKLPPNDC